MPSQLVQQPPSGPHPPARAARDPRVRVVEAPNVAEPDAAPRSPAGDAVEDSSFEILECLDDAYALFDRGGCLLFCNRAYREVFAAIADQLLPGSRLEDLVRAAIAQGPFADPGHSADRLVRRCLHLHRGPEPVCEVELRSERSLRIRARLTSTGLRLDHCAILEPAGNRQQAAAAPERGPSPGVDTGSGASRRAARAAARLRDVIESVNDGLALFDDRDRLVICNHRFEEIEAAGAELTPGTRWDEILRAGVERRQYAEAVDRAEAYVASRSEHHRRADGALLEQRLCDGRWVQIGEHRASDGGTIATRTDITELKRRETDRIELSDELRTQYSRFNAALNNMIQGLCMFDVDQRLIVCNERYLQMYGFSPDVVKPGIRLREIMEYSVSLGNYRREDAERAIAERPTTANKREQAVLHQRLNDGRVIAVMHQPMAGGGSVATYEDVTQTVRAEEALREYARKLERSNRELQDFASIASHDLQEPLRKIEAFGDRLKAKCGDELDDLGRTYIDRMQDAASRMRSLINDLLTYSQVTTRARPFVPVDLGRIAAEVMSDLQVSIEQAGARIELGELPVIEADPTQMRQLLQNLLSNALKFRRQGVPPVIRVRGRLRGPAGASNGNSRTARLCEVTVADNGIGFKPDYAGRIFGIFQRLHGRNEYPGTGIGLATCRKILERHGGTVTASGRSGEGATFVFTLPIAQTREPVL